MTGKEDEDFEGGRAARHRIWRLSVALILGVAAVGAAGVWALSSWYAVHYGSVTRVESPPLPSVPAGGRTGTPKPH